MNKTTTYRVTIPFIHGTAKQVERQSIIPLNKKGKELFWTKQLFEHNQMLSALKVRIDNNEDDSNGQSDILINGNLNIGVQLTELTFEFEQSKRAQKIDFTNKLINQFKSLDIKTEHKTSITIKIFNYTKGFLQKKQIEKLAEEIKAFIKNTGSNTFITGNYKLEKDIVYKGDFYIPNINNIGLIVDFDIVTICLDYYEKCIDLIYEKKNSSTSDWLVIWSKDYWHDKFEWGDKILNYMQSKFEKSSFKSIYFIESIDGVGLFEANISINKIK